MKYDLALISCSATKRDYRVTAKRLYTSPLFKASRRWAEANADRWAILSAKHGILWPNVETDPYDKTMQSKDRDRVRQWAFWCQADLCSIVSDLGRIPTTAVLAGKAYTDPLRNVGAIKGFDEPLAGMMIGERLRWLNQQNNNAAPIAVAADESAPVQLGLFA